ncbi:unnamed protein product, partial [Nesidiocoris tenuis]
MQCAKRELTDPPVDPVKCATCLQQFHAACTRLETIEKWTKMSYDKRDTWKCDLCREDVPPKDTPG